MHDRMLLMTNAFKGVLTRLIRHIEAGMTYSIAWEIAFRELDDEYRKACLLEQLPPQNHMLDALSVEMFARFGLDALFSNKVAAGSNSDQRAAFWAVFHRVTRPTTKAVTPSIEPKVAGRLEGPGY